MNVLAFMAFLFALICLLFSVHVGWAIWLVAVGGLLLSISSGLPSWTPPWKHN